MLGDALDWGGTVCLFFSESQQQQEFHSTLIAFSHTVRHSPGPLDRGFFGSQAGYDLRGQRHLPSAPLFLHDPDGFPGRQDGARSVLWTLLSCSSALFAGLACKMAAYCGDTEGHDLCSGHSTHRYLVGKGLQDGANCLVIVRRGCGVRRCHRWAPCLMATAD